MPRPRREDYEGAWQHAMNRGVDRAPIFRSDADRQIFLDSLQTAADRYGLQVHGYCLLGNHYHLMLFSEKRATVGRHALPIGSLHAEDQLSRQQGWAAVPGPLCIGADQGRRASRLRQSLHSSQPRRSGARAQTGRLDLVERRRLPRHEEAAVMASDGCNT